MVQRLESLAVEDLCFLVLVRVFQKYHIVLYMDRIICEILLPLLALSNGVVFSVIWSSPHVRCISNVGKVSLEKKIFKLTM